MRDEYTRSDHGMIQIIERCETVAGMALSSPPPIANSESRSLSDRHSDSIQTGKGVSHLDSLEWIT
jgi:hypothetical protein